MLEFATQPQIEIITDAPYIIKGFRRGRNITKSQNWDLWRRFWLAIDKRGGPRTVKFVKIKSHLTEAQAKNGHAALEDFWINDEADQLAEKAATKSALPPADLELIQNTDARAWRVQKRILAAHEIACAGDRPVQDPRACRGRREPPSLDLREP